MTDCAAWQLRWLLVVCGILYQIDTYTVLSFISCAQMEGYCCLDIGQQNGCQQQKKIMILVDVLD